jgi:hypothetical protein
MGARESCCCCFVGGWFWGESRDGIEEGGGRGGRVEPEDSCRGRLRGGSEEEGGAVVRRLERSIEVPRREARCAGIQLRDRRFCGSIVVC